jgi:hypothetical protein
MGDVFAQSISRQHATLIGVPYSLRFINVIIIYLVFQRSTGADIEIVNR